MNEIIQGDCLEEMRKMEDNSISAIVTDPPYGLGFMNKAWDAGLPHAEIWKEALRIAKPGAFLLAFGGTRTYHRLTCAVEDAGWEIRDCMMWLYGSGFPKSHDISKGIDKKREDDLRPICRFLRNEIEIRGIHKKQLADRFGFHPRMIDHWAASDSDSQPAIPTVDQWNLLKSIIHFSSVMDEEVVRLNKRKNQWGEAAFERGTIEPTGGLKGGSGNTVGCFTGKQLSTNAILPLAKQFSGYGTALKPAYEPIIMAMKPCDGTFKENADKWGQAGINIDGCRIPANWDTDPNKRGLGYGFTTDTCFSGLPARSEYDTTKGRWPANVIFDEEAAKMLDEQSGKLAKSSIREWNNSYSANNVLDHGLKPIKIKGGINDTGGASRFFYCAKASSRERNEGLEDFEDKPAFDNPNGAMGGNMGSLSGPRKNNHPTVKPLKLMEYLIKLVMPPKNGVLLDPFAGSGSTILAAKRFGFSAIGIEMQAEYCEIARARLNSVENPVDEKRKMELFA